MKIIDFKTVSPLFEQERDGIKPFTVRMFDGNDARFKSLSHEHQSKDFYYIRITNPATGKSFIRTYIDREFLKTRNWRTRDPEWLIIHMGEKVDADAE